MLTRNGLLILACLTIPLSAATLTVDDSGGQDYTSIQTAITHAVSGDTVFVYPGTYHEQIELKDGVSLIGSGPHRTVIDGQGAFQRIISYPGGGGDGAKITGFRIKGAVESGSWNAAGIYCENGPIFISNNIIEDNRSGIALGYMAVPSIVNNTIVHNYNGIIVGPAVAPPLSKILYVYNTDAALADQYKILMDAHGFNTTLVTVASVSKTEYSPYELIVVGPDTGDWSSSRSVQAIADSELPILGLGSGGLKLFEQLRLSLTWGHSWIGNETAIHVVNPSHKMFNQPHTIEIPENGNIQIYNTTTHYGLYRPSLASNVVLLGRETNDADHYPIVQEGKCIAWSFSAGPDQMTETGKRLFINTVSYATGVRIAYIYNSDTTTANSFQSFLSDYGNLVTLIKQSDLVTNPTVLHPYYFDVIIIGDDASDWSNQNMVNAVYNSGRPVLGVGIGGYNYFGKLNLSTGSPHGSHSTEKPIFSMQRDHPIFTVPYPFYIDDVPSVYPYTDAATVNRVEIYLNPVPSHVLDLGRSLAWANYYPLTLEYDFYLLWGWGNGGGPTVMTDSGKFMFLNALKYLQPSPTLYHSNQIIKNNIVASNTGQNIFYYTPFTDGEFSYNDVWPATYFSNLSGVNFSPQPGTGEISADPLFANDQYRLAEGSPCIDAGHPGLEYLDPDGTRNDMGAYGGPDAVTGQSGHAGSGFIFTSIGDIPTSEITQTSGSPSIGLANVSQQIHNDLGVELYKDAPFGGRLWLHGLFGDQDPVDYYQILVARWPDNNTQPDPADFVPLTDTLTKVKYTRQSDNTIKYEYINLGPQTVGSTANVYQLTRDGWWSHIDLRMIWNTTLWPNGKYTLIAKSYQQYYSFPWYYLVPLTNVDSQELILIVDNSPVEAEIHSVRYTSTNPNYNPITDGLIPECGIIKLAGIQENLRFTIAASHPNGYLRDYTLRALYGKNKNGGLIAYDQYAGVHDVPPPFWPGLTEQELTPRHPSVDWQPCAYEFRLGVWGRTTDGKNYIKYSEFSDHYYIQLAAGCCHDVDLDNNGHIDLRDLLVLSQYWLQTCNPAGCTPLEP